MYIILGNARYTVLNVWGGNFWLGSGNSNNANNVWNVNSDGNINNNNYGVRPVDSISCGYVIMCCIRVSIETNWCPVIRFNLIINKK